MVFGHDLGLCRPCWYGHGARSISIRRDIEIIKRELAVDMLESCAHIRRAAQEAQPEQPDRRAFQPGP
jgi:hypothetical protein